MLLKTIVNQIIQTEKKGNYTISRDFKQKQQKSLATFT